MKLGERYRVNRKIIDAKEAAGKLTDAEVAKKEMDAQVRERMGPLLYYLTPWNRVRMEVKIEKRKQIEAQLAAKVDEDNEVEEDVIKLEIKK